MLPFLHDRVRVLGGLLDRSSAVLAKYNALDLDVQTALVGLLDESVSVYHRLNRSTVENHLLALKAECITAREGTNPVTLERVATHRRAMQRAVALRVLGASAEQLRTDVELDTRKLAEATALLRPIVLAGIQNGVVPVPWREAGDAQALERIWKAMLADPDLRLAARQVAMQVSVYDIHLLLEPLLASAAT